MIAALETENEIGNVTQKLLEKNTNKISIINQKATITFDVKTKKEVAIDIVNYILDNINSSMAE